MSTEGSNILEVKHEHVRRGEREREKDGEKQRGWEGRTEEKGVASLKGG